ncbi:hypothetical protein [Cryobacterium sp. TMT2-42-4]|uniref:hypothetical protein n=1 Tax=Cryobacterium sp. TMT2-42-4 TaxID=1259255 RepID=UPI00106A0C00|nr:hypothetical protein [Cryobacterium sp. TMT2-42-4]TFC38464.1 hypothetical protein E3O18_02565 [Cryobacterium sp. TMT2-42-4]
MRLVPSHERLDPAECWVAAQTSPAGVGIVQGTSFPHGPAAVAALMRALASARPEPTVALGFVDVQRPDTPETLSPV